MSRGAATVPAHRVGRGAIWVVALLAVAVVVVLLARPGRGAPAPYDPRSTAPDGTRALVLLLEEEGVGVTVGDAVPESGVVLVLADELRDRQRTALLSWVEAGGVLVVADPTSTLHGGAGRDGGAATVEGVRERGRCTVDELATLRTIDVGAGLAFPVAPADTSCFGDDRHAVVLQQRQGAGSIVALGSADPFTNALLATQDNAALALDLLVRSGHDRRVTILEAAVAGSGDEHLLELVSPKVWQMLALVGVAFLVVVLWRARRLGAPVTETVPVEIPGSELVLARADLLRRAGQPGRAARALQGDLHRELSLAFGVPMGAPLDTLDAAVSARTGLARGTVVGVLAAPAAVDDAGLAQLSAAVDAVRAAADPHRTMGGPR